MIPSQVPNTEENNTGGNGLSGEELVRRARQLTILLSISRQLNEVLDTPVVLRRLIAAAMELTDGNSGAAGIMEDGKMVFTEYNEHGILLPVRLEFPLDYGVPGWVMRTMEPYLSNDAEHDPHVVPEIRKALGIRNLIDVPIISRNRELLGCFEVHNKPTPFDEHDVELLQALAASAAVALENARILAESRKTERAFQEAEARYRALVEESLVGVYITRVDRFLYVNPRFAETLGYTQHEMTSDIMAMDTVAPKDRQMVAERLRRRINGEIPSDHYTFTGLRKDGTELDLEVYGTRTVMAGEPVIIGTVLDVTERKETEEALRRSEEKFRQLIEDITDWVWAVDLDGRYTYASPAVERILGYTPQEVVGKTAFDLIVPEDRGSVAKAFEEAVKARWEITNLLNRNLRKDGELRYLETSGRPIFDQAGELVGYRGVDRDITDRVLAVNALRRSEARFKAIFEEAPAAMIIYDLEGRITRANSTFEQMTGYPKEQSIGHTIFETIVDPEDAAKARDVIRRAARGETVQNVEWRAVRPDGDIYYVLTNITPLIGERGEIEAVLALGTDITHRRLAEQRARELEEQKREFYRRTIMAATEGKLLIMDEGDICRRAGELLGTWRLESAEELSAVRSQVADSARLAGMDEDRVFDFTLCAGEATTNAIKHANGGKASLHRKDDDLLFVVSDQGPGIDALALPEVALKRGYSTAVSLGMGYKAMISIADTVYLDTGPRGTMVGIEMGLHAEREPYKLAGLPDTWLTKL